MFAQINNKIVDSACQSGLINQSDKVIYQFGIEATLLKCVHVITMLLIGAAFGMPLESITFLVTYSSLRIYAGGFHAKSRFRCFLISCAMTTGVLLTVKYFSSGIGFQFAVPVALAAMGLILSLSPVATVNKPLDETEVRHYKKQVQLILCFHLLFLAIFLFAGLYKYFLLVCFSEVMLAAMLIIGYIQLKFKRR